MSDLAYFHADSNGMRNWPIPLADSLITQQARVRISDYAPGANFCVSSRFSIGSSAVRWPRVNSISKSSLAVSGTTVRYAPREADRGRSISLKMVGLNGKAVPLTRFVSSCAIGWKFPENVTGVYLVALSVDGKQTMQRFFIANRLKRP